MTNPTYISGAGTQSGGFTYTSSGTSGGSVYVVSGGLAYNMTIDKGALETLAAGGSATNTLINVGGEVDVEGAGASASRSRISGGIQSVTSGGAFYTEVYAGGLEDVSSGGSDFATTINKSGGEHVYSGGVTYDSTVEKGGTEGISQGGDASGTAVADGGRIIVAGDLLYSENFTATSGSEKAVGVYKGGVETINITGGKKAKYDEITNTATADGFIRTYDLNGTEKFSEQRIGNELYYTSGSETISFSSPQYLTPGSADTVTVASGGSAVFGGGIITNLTVASGGEEIIGGTTTVHSAGAKYIFKFTGLTVSDTVVAKGVKEIVNSGNTALSATISAGGTQDVKKGATAQSSLIDGGTLDLSTGGKLKTAVTFKGKGGELEIGGTVTPTTTISGFTTTDKIKFLNITSATGAYATVATAGVVTIEDGGVSYKLNIAGATVGEAFNFSSASILTVAPAAAFTERAASATVAALIVSGGAGG
jgi:autotransporter passenger strand-loop-strand repeat protein